MISQKYVLLTFLLFLFAKYSYPMGDNPQQVYFGITGEKTITFSRPEQYPLGHSTCSQTFDYKNAPSGSLELQLADQQAESIKTIHSLVHDIISLQQNPIGFRNSILFEQGIDLFCGNNIYPHETIQPYKHETILCSDGFGSSQHNSSFNGTMYTTADSQSLKSGTAVASCSDDRILVLQKASPRDNFNKALKQITRFSIKHDTDYNSIFDCAAELSHNHEYMTKAILARYKLDIDQAKEVLGYVKQYEIARIDIALEEIKNLQSFSAREFQDQINKYSPPEMIKLKQDCNREFQRIISNSNGLNKDITSYEQGNRRDLEDVAYRSTSRKILERCNLWRGDYREDYYTRIAKRDKKISELKCELEKNKALQELSIAKIKIIEKVEKTIAETYKQELLNQSSDDLRILLERKHKIIKIIKVDEEFGITQELIDAHKLEYDCIKEAFNEKRMTEYIALLHEQYGDDIHTYVEINITESPNLIIQERYGTLQQARGNNFETSLFNFQLNDRERNSLDKKGIDVSLFEQIKGNAFVGQLCKEQCTILNHVGQLREDLRHSPRYIKPPQLTNLLQTPKEEFASAIQSSEQFADCCLELTTDSTILANQALHAGNLEQTVKLNDYSWAMLEALEKTMTIGESCKQFAIGFVIDGPKNVVTNIYQLGTDIGHVVSKIVSDPANAIPHYLEKHLEYHQQSQAELMAYMLYYDDHHKIATMLMNLGYHDRASEILEEDAKILELYATQQTWPESARMHGAFISEEIINTGIRILIGKGCRLARIGSARAKQFLKRTSKPQLLMRTPEGQVVKATKDSFKKARNLGNYQKFSREVSAFYAKGRKANSEIKGIKGFIKNQKLPTKGKIRFVPPKGIKLSEMKQLKVTINKKGKIIRGFKDRFGNTWVKGESRTAGQPLEWDVQLSPIGKQQLGHMTRDNTHLNVSMDGRVTHK